MGLCEGSIVKYVTRWRDKGGMNDLRKARHYIDFLLEDRRYQDNLARLRALDVISKLQGGIGCEEFIKANRTPRLEAAVIRNIWHWNLSGRPCNLRAAARWCDDLIAAALADEAPPAEVGGA